MRRSLLLLSFIEGAAVMAAELCGARLLSPVFGSSLYVWAAVMGVTLGALAAGYFAGGRVRPGRQKEALRLILIGAAIYMMLMSTIAEGLFPRFSQMDLVPAVIISTVILLLPPVAALGAASPLFIALQTRDVKDAGRVSGTVYGISTAGGIFSTFLSGFLLIPDLGLQFTCIAHGSLLLAATLIILRGGWAAPLGIAVIIISLRNIPGSSEESLYREDGIQGRISVTESAVEGAPRRRLLVNNIIQSEIDPRTGNNTMAYLRKMDSLTPGAGAGERALVLGLGGGSAAKMLKEKGYTVTAVELDVRVIDVAARYFSAGNDIRVVHDDARRFMNSDTVQYHIVLTDLFNGEEQPSHVFTVQSLLRLRRHLSGDGLLLINWHGYTSGEDGRGTGVLLNTLKAAGFSYQLHYTAGTEDYRSTVLAAVPAGTTGAVISLTNTDDKPAMEKYNARAYRKWRQNYLRYYNASR